MRMRGGAAYGAGRSLLNTKFPFKSSFSSFFSLERKKLFPCAHCFKKYVLIAVSTKTTCLIFVKHFCNVVPASGHEVRMVVIVMLMMIKRCWSEFAEGGPGLGLHTAEPQAGWGSSYLLPPITPRLNSSLPLLTITLTLTICDTNPHNFLRSTSHL